MTAGALFPGQEFKLPGQKKYITVGRIHELERHDHIPPLGRKVIVISGCNQMTMLKNIKVIIKEQV